MGDQYIEAVRDWPVPCDVKGVERFLGFANYHCSYIPQFSRIASPLYAVIGKGGFRWGDDQQDAFDELLRSMNNPPVLAIPNSQGHIGSCRRRGIKSSPERKRENNRLWQRSAISRTTVVLYHQERVTGGDQIYSPIPPLSQLFQESPGSGGNQSAVESNFKELSPTFRQAIVSDT